MFEFVVSQESKFMVDQKGQSWMAKHSEVFVLKLQLLGWGTERLLSASVAWKANWFHFIR
ncbi:hypothetical protein OROMI_013503 [Orobanche minor]